MTNSVWNEEVMKLYREHKVNPLGGCLPLLLQIPVFFALYRVLLSSIELRQAPFLWINDLSAAEATTIPVFVIAMGASMWLQQKMSPTSMDSHPGQDDDVHADPLHLLVLEFSRRLSHLLVSE